MHRNDNGVIARRLLAALILDMIMDGIEEHQHTCTECNHSWHHTGQMAGNTEAHMCPNCQSGPFWART